ncbi:MAG: Nif3-like dinuclear metal center hexameric protein [Deltaproteobacteria bacterium]|nr:Nif3-like dinuclear metal center hexameric protein [Deltaproteobacteria bacterium]
MKKATVSDITSVMEKIAPQKLAEKWDNVGLQLGAASNLVKKIRIALDPSCSVINKACKDNIDMLIVHHPLIFTPLKHIREDTAFGKSIYNAIKNNLAIFVAHTNLDKAKNGLNDLLAEKIGLKSIKIFGPKQESEYVKLALFAPEEFEEKLLNSLFEISDFQIDNYSCCSFRNYGTGTFTPHKNAKPFIGEADKLSNVKEVKIEAIIEKEKISEIIASLKSAHPYETMAYDIYPLYGSSFENGLARQGELKKPETLYNLARNIKEKLKLSHLKYCGKPDIKVKKGAICAGSGSSLMKYFLKSDADVYITGDVRYHDAKDAENNGRAIIDIGHFGSEIIITKELTKRLSKLLAQTEFDINVEACNSEEEPFKTIGYNK